jgi:cytochrome c oxidase subunit 3
VAYAFTPTHESTERTGAGHGGKPPLSRRPTGGGGGGGDDGSNGPQHGPREALHRVRVFLFSALAADEVFFLVVVLLFYARQSSTHMDPRTLRQIADWRPIPLPAILLLNTVALALSSGTAEAARRHIFKEIDVMDEWLGLGRPALRRSQMWLAGTLALGALFLAGQWQAWRQLYAQGYTFSGAATPASYFFCLLTGLHALHVLAGLLAILFCLIVLRYIPRVESRQIAIDATVWFWHVMGLTWLALCGVLLFGQ